MNLLKNNINYNSRMPKKINKHLIQVKEGLILKIIDAIYSETITIIYTKSQNTHLAFFWQIRFLLDN
jgi:hypothetical protein